MIIKAARIGLLLLIVLRGVVAHAPEASERGSLDAYRRYRALIAQVGELCTARRIRCDVELTPQLVGLENRRVEVVDRWSERKRFLVGKSMGLIPIHLEIANRRSLDGPGVVGARFESVRVLGRPS